MTPAGEASEWPTGFIAHALHDAGAEASALECAADALVASQNRDGGWGYHGEVPSDADSTECVLLFLARLRRHRNSQARAVACLVRHQRCEDGGISTYAEPGPIRGFMGVGRWMRFGGWCSPHTEVTATAGCALAAAAPDGSHPQADAAWSYVRSAQRLDGSWGSYWWTSPHYATLQAVELASALGERERVQRACDWALRAQTAGGGWNAPGAATSAFATALSLSILLHARSGGPPLERAIATLAAAQDEDGGWPSHPIMRIPLPGDADPDRRRLRRLGRLGHALVVRDHRRCFTSAVCVAALARANARAEPVDDGRE